MTLETLYKEYSRLKTVGWNKDLVFNHGEENLPVHAYTSPNIGSAIWIISGIHGKEKAGPRALAKEIKNIAKLAEICPVMIIPLANAIGYKNNWRYTHPSEDGDLDGNSVGDPNTIEGQQLSKYLLEISKKYPPMLSIDHHHDITLPWSYLYSQGILGLNDPVAREIIRIMSAVTKIQMNGATRWQEPIINGIVGPVKDGSVDDFVTKPPISAKTSIVVETSNIEAHIAIIKAYPAIVAVARQLANN